MSYLKHVILISTLALASNSIFAMLAPPEDCGSTLDLAGFTSPISTTTVGASNAFSFCTMGSSPDLILYIDLLPGETLTIQQTVNGYDSRHSLRYSGACPGTIELDCTDDPDLSVETWQNCTGATQRVYWIQAGYTTNSGTFTLAWSVAAGTCPVPPANDNCAGALPVTVNPDFSCAATTAGTVLNATQSAQSAASCGGTEDDDVWFSFVATGTVHTIDLLNISGSTTDMYHSVWSGSCATALVAGSCSDPNSQTVTGLTAGNTYYIRVYTWTSTTGQTSVFDVCVGTPPPPPANDECAGAFPVTVNPDFSCAATTAGTVASATPSAQNTAACGGTEDDDVWFSFVATGTVHTIDILNIAGSTTDMYHSVWSGSCATTLVAGSCSDPNSQTVTGLTAGNTYYIRVYTWTGTTGQTSAFDVCVGTPPPPPANDECAGAIALTVNPDNLCGTVTPGTVASATPSAQNTASCGGTEDDDVWYSFVATGPTHLISILNISGSTTDMYHSVWSGSCATTVVAGSCSDPNSSTVTGLTAGTTYYIRVYTWTSTTGQTSSFDVCVGTPPPPPANDECAGAVAVTVNPDQMCGSTTTGTIMSASPSPDANSCGGTDDDDVWYSFVATSTTHSVDLLNISGSTTDLYHSVFTGSCGSLGAALLCSDPNSSSISSLTIGQTYYVRVYTWTATAGQSTIFDICVGTPPPTGPCGNAMNNDYCSDPATLTQGGSGWSSSTTSLYSADCPANSCTVFCGSVENNSWYSFVAGATSESFFFSSITNCANNWGIQAEVYDVTTDGNGCCTNFTSMSNCYNPATTAPGTVTATGLTIGNTYYLMIDGNAGDQCDFTVDNWTASGILPVDLVSFTGKSLGENNLLTWSTASEIGNDYFSIERAENAIEFSEIDRVAGSGNSTALQNYSFTDNNIDRDYYYRLRQVDFNGDYEYSKIVFIENEVNSGVNIYPNPTSGILNFDFVLSRDGHYSIIISDILGNVFSKEVFISESNKQIKLTEFDKFAKGFYTIKIVDDNNNLITVQKIIKN